MSSANAQAMLMMRSALQSCGVGATATEATLLAQLTGAEATAIRRCLRELSESHDAAVASIETFLRRRSSSSHVRAAA